MSEKLKERAAKPESEPASVQSIVPMPQYIIRDPDGTQVELNEYQEDIFDDDNDTVFRRIEWWGDSLLDCKRYGELFDVILRRYPEIQDGQLNDSVLLDVKMSLGDLRRLNCLSALLQGTSRVRNPDMDQIFKRDKS